MAEYTKYPSQLDDSNSLPKATDNVTPVKAEVVNRLREALMTTQSELGANPSGTYSTVKARLDYLEANGGGTTTTQVQESITAASDGQTSFTLTKTPYQSTAVKMYINGLKQKYGTDYSVSGVSVTYSGASILTSDDVEFWYLTEAGKSVGGDTVGEGGASSKIRRYRGTSNLAGAAEGTAQAVTWNTTSSLVTVTNATFTSTTISPSVDGHYIISGQLTISPTVDSVSSVTIEVLKNGTAVYELLDSGAVWGVGINRSLNFHFPIDLVSGDDLSVQWTHSGSTGSTTELIFGDTKSWFALSKV